LGEARLHVLGREREAALASQPEHERHDAVVIAGARFELLRELRVPKSLLVELGQPLGRHGVLLVCWRYWDLRTRRVKPARGGPPSLQRFRELPPQLDAKDGTVDVAKADVGAGAQHAAV